MGHISTQSLSPTSGHHICWVITAAPVAPVRLHNSTLKEKELHAPNTVESIDSDINQRSTFIYDNKYPVHKRYLPRNIRTIFNDGRRVCTMTSYRTSCTVFKRQSAKSNQNPISWILSWEIYTHHVNIQLAT